MRIWLVQIAESTPHDDDGKRRIMRTGILANSLQEAGHSVVWWTSCFDHFKHKKRYDESIRISVKSNYCIHYLKSIGYKGNRSIRRIIDQKYIARRFSVECRADKDLPDVILASLPSIELAWAAVQFGRDNDIPVYVDIRDLWPDVFKVIFPRYMDKIVEVATFSMKRSVRKIIRNARGVTGITEEFVNWGLSHGEREKTDNDRCFPMAYIRHSPDKKDYLNAQRYWKNLGLSISTKELVVLFIGSFTKTCDFETIFEAAKKLDEQSQKIKFIFCGIGARKSYIRSGCDKYKNCLYAGWVNAAQIKVALEFSDIGIAPYVETPNFVNNIPNKPPEYMSEGLVLAVSLKRGKLVDLVEGEKCGFSYAHDADLLVSELIDLNENRTLLSTSKAASKAVFDRLLNGEKVYQSMVSFLESGADKREETEQKYG